MARETFADRLRRLAAKADLNEADIASASGISATTAGRLLNGSTPSIKLDAALRLCRRLGVSPWELAGEREPSGGSDGHPQGLETVVVQLREDFAKMQDGLSEMEDRIARAVALLGRETGLPDATIQRMQRELQQPA